MEHEKYNIGYAMSGGSIKGFAHLGMIQSLIEHDIHPDIISGVSAGAMTGVLLADGREPYQVLELFRDKKVRDFASISMSRRGVLNQDEFIDFLRTHLRTKNIEDLPIPTIITATDLDHGHSTHFRTGEIAIRVAASCCMPVLCCPIKINGTNYVDGGVLMNLPVTTLTPICHKVAALNVSPMLTRKYRQNMVSIALRSYNFIFQANTFPQKQEADLLIETYGLQDYRNSDLDKIDEIFRKGYLAANSTLDRLIRANGTIWKTKQKY